MKNRGELGCGLLIIVALIGAAIFVLYKAPWLLIAGPILLVLAVIAVVVLADVTSDDVLMPTDEAGGFAAGRLTALNALRRLVNKPAVWQVPKSGISPEERQLVKQAARLSAEIESALRNSIAPIPDRELARQQVDAIPGNMTAALWRLVRLRRMARSLDAHSDDGRRAQADMSAAERAILDGMQGTLNMLAPIPVSIVRAEVAQADRPAARLLTDLSETNQRLRDVTATYDELKGRQAQ